MIAYDSQPAAVACDFRFQIRFIYVVPVLKCEKYPRTHMSYMVNGAQSPSKSLFSHRRAQPCDVINKTDTGVIELVLRGDLALAAALPLKTRRV